MVAAIHMAPDINRGPTELGLGVAFNVLAALQVAWRIQTRIFVVRAVGWDDWIAGLAMVFSLTQLGLSCASISWGYGRHIYYLTPQEIHWALKFTIIAEPINVFAVGLQKVSIAVALLRLSLGNWYRVIVWISIVPNIIIVLITMVAMFGRCSNYAMNWDLTAPGHCWSTMWNVATGYAQAASNIQVDIAFTVAPILYLAKVQISNYNQWALRVIFLVSLFATICSIVKMTCLPILVGTEDPTWDGVPLSIWSTLELTIGLMVASAPALKPRYEWFLKKFLDVSGISSSRTKPGMGYGSNNRYGPGTNGKGGYGQGSMHRSQRGATRLEDEEDIDESVGSSDIKMDYFSNKAMGAVTPVSGLHTEVKHDYGRERHTNYSGRVGLGRSPSSGSSQEIILQGTKEGSEEQLKSDQIRVTQTVTVSDWK